MTTFVASASRCRRRFDVEPAMTVSVLVTGKMSVPLAWPESLSLLKPLEGAAGFSDWTA